MDRRSFFSNLISVSRCEGITEDADSTTSSPKIELIPHDCLAYSGCICSSCREVCPEDAIHFSGLFNPVILEDLCTGCKQCLSVCPSGALVASEDDSSDPDSVESTQQERLPSGLTSMDELLS
ncbi:MAG: hypothetical protein CSA81_05145 [Acidobacteria bacterium]|nr:MAG: hypothetical protein CSA81_05145 [Acidobacteriota bacterium]PIE91025.1 MAG: hypothetical protein CR997_02590 [Acidobacteriota bacterium]